MAQGTMRAVLLGILIWGAFSVDTNAASSGSRFTFLGKRWTVTSRTLVDVKNIMMPSDKVVKTSDDQWIASATKYDRNKRILQNLIETPYWKNDKQKKFITDATEFFFENATEEEIKSYESMAERDNLERAQKGLEPLSVKESYYKSILWCMDENLAYIHKKGDPTRFASHVSQLLHVRLHGNVNILYLVDSSHLSYYKRYDPKSNQGKIIPLPQKYEFMDNYGNFMMFHGVVIGDIEILLDVAEASSNIPILILRQPGKAPVKVKVPVDENGYPVDILDYAQYFYEQYVLRKDVSALDIYGDKETSKEELKRRTDALHLRILKLLELTNSTLEEEVVEPNFQVINEQLLEYHRYLGSLGSVGKIESTPEEKEGWFFSRFFRKKNKNSAEVSSSSVFKNIFANTSEVLHNISEIERATQSILVNFLPHIQRKLRIPVTEMTFTILDYLKGFNDTDNLYLSRMDSKLYNPILEEIHKVIPDAEIKIGFSNYKIVTSKDPISNKSIATMEIHFLVKSQGSTFLDKKYDMVFRTDEDIEKKGDALFDDWSSEFLNHYNSVFLKSLENAMITSLENEEETVEVMATAGCATHLKANTSKGNL